MQPYITRALEFLRIVDPHDGNVSISNALLVAVLVKILCAKTAGLGDLGMLLCAIGNYNAKKIINQATGQPEPDQIAPAPPPASSPIHSRGLL
jgi:hypothetical protein